MLLNGLAVQVFRAWIVKFVQPQRLLKRAAGAIKAQNGRARLGEQLQLIRVVRAGAAPSDALVSAFRRLRGKFDDLRHARPNLSNGNLVGERKLSRGLALLLDGFRLDFFLLDALGLFHRLLLGFRAFDALL